MQSNGIVLPSLAFGPLLDKERYRRLEAEAMKRSFGVSVIHISIERRQKCTGILNEYSCTQGFPIGRIVSLAQAIPHIKEICT